MQVSWGLVGAGFCLSRKLSFALVKIRKSKILFLIMMSRTPFRHPHWRVINRAELDVCTPNSFGESKTHRKQELRLLV